MNANDILGIVVCIIFFVMGTYFNYKFKQVGKDEESSHKKV